MAFIGTIAEADIDEEGRAMYDRLREHHGYLPNYALVFSHRPEVMRLWAQLQSGIRRHMDRRRFELITFTAAHALRSTLCTLAHGKALTSYFSMEDVVAMAHGDAPPSLTDAEAVMLAFSRKVARDPSGITADDTETLRQQGFTEPEIFDIAATAAARAFLSTLVESLGVEPDAPFQVMDRSFAKALTVGRPITRS